MSERKLSHWMDADCGDQLHLTDPETLEDNINGHIVTIDNITRIEGNLSHLIYELDNDQVIVVQHCEGEFSIYLCEPCNELTGNRENVPFIFNKDDTYVDWLDSPDGSRFTLMPMGEMTYELDDDGAIATVVQYSSDEAGDLILIEIDNVDNPLGDGGYIDGYMAQLIKLTDIELYGV